jgi:hypothetical protein
MPYRRRLRGLTLNDSICFVPGASYRELRIDNHLLTRLECLEHRSGILVLLSAHGSYIGLDAWRQKYKISVSSQDQCREGGIA